MEKINLILKLAWKDLMHNSRSSTLIILVIGTICLPTIILLSLREGYVVLFKEWIERTTPAKQLDVNVNITQNEDLRIDAAMIQQWEQRKDVDLVIPHINFRTLIESPSGGMDYYKLISTIPGDPELKRLGSGGRFDLAAMKKCGLVISGEEFRLRGMEFGEKIGVILERGAQKRRIEVPVVDTIHVGKGKKMVFGSLKLLNHYDRWVKGYGVEDEQNKIFLPASNDREESLGSISAGYFRIFKKLPFSKAEKRLLENDLELDLKYENGEDNFIGVAQKKDGRQTGISDWELVEETLSGTYDAIVIPNIPEMQVFAGKYKLYPSSSIDPRQSFALKKGNWIQGETSRLDILVHDSELEDIGAIGDFITQEIGGTSVKFNIVGTHRLEPGKLLVDYTTLYRLHQLADAKAKFVLETEKFEPKESFSYDEKAYTIARVHVNKLEDVIPIHDELENSGFDIPASSKSEISHYMEIKSILTGFVLLLAIVGAIACIASLFVLMYEAIQRKRSQIGIMKTVGIGENFIVNVYTLQSLLYGFMGLLLAFVVFFLLRLGLDSSFGHTIFNVPAQEGQLFQLSIQLILIVFLGVGLVSLFAGWMATLSVRKMDPADIIIGN